MRLNPVVRESAESLIEYLRTKVSNSDRVVMLNEPWDPKKYPRVFVQKPGIKPTGLWYALGLEWIRWTASETPEWLGKYFYRLSVNESLLLQLATVRDTLLFAKRFSIPPERGLYINWPEISSQYGGIEINPYQWSLSNRFTWYNTWDVSSGCIWNPLAIISIEEVQ